MSTDITRRLDAARTAAAEAGVDALLVTPGADLRYLTGFAAMPLERLTCLVLPVEGDPVLVLPRLELAMALEAGVDSHDIVLHGWGETEDPFAAAAAPLEGARRVAVDDHMWAERVFAFRSALPGAEQVLASPVLRGLRLRKTATEVDALREAGAAIDRVHSRVGEWLRPGRTEREVGRDLAEAILAEGHESVDFVIVGSGPNGASPHAEVSDRVIEAGAPVVIDIGGTMPSGYCSDSTRTYVAGGTAPAELVAFYEVLQRAQEAQCAHARPGVTAGSVDTVGRDLIDAAGFGKAFLHRTGHGIGLETHEEPYIVTGNDLVLEPGMAFSIEPGIYLEGKYGARIEDIVVTTDDGLERLNLTSRDLVVID
ncbi:aminopeptidase P family protein [Mumia sp. ZJ1417]|uniref:M24 family metallopeptidase n=1 Tax=Mumia sp. ZJ1417 TaxID=2708082 RepID=UPI0014233A56|nr:Xaa-Pro peptidase family protein [Mumia sp. ZJ1417]QMW64657.1 aminopeptidase P family protein [Mumia sp. ZJ1417]